MRRYSTISFLSDYGHADEFVGVVKSVIRALAPEVAVIDLCHEIPAHDVRAGALTLARSAQYLAPGVVLAVVDPGVGTERRAIAVEVGEGQSVLVGPDNGLLAPAVAMVGGATRAVQLTNPDFQLEAPGPTFAGRDVFAPAAAHLCRGVDLAEFGEELDPATLLPGVVPVPRLEGDTVTADVLWIDRYGNAQLNVDPDDLAEWGDRLRIRTGDDLRSARRVGSFEDLGTGEVGLVVDSYGLLALAVPRSSAAALLRLEAGSAVVLERVEPDDRAGEGEGVGAGEGVAADVELRRRP
jgi:S-adenosylmethionine hydrolase